MKQQRIATFSSGPDSFQVGGLSNGEILLDGAEDWGVIRAATDLADDFNKVTGSGLTVEITNATESTGRYEYRVPLDHAGEFKTTGPFYFEIPGIQYHGASSNTVIIAGTLGKSQIIDALVEQGKINVSSIRNEWECFTSTVVSQPVEGVKEALIIAGSDRRGTIFGLYTLSREIGVSPFYWWADVNVEKKQAVYIQRGTAIVQKTPSVYYRGFFLNDEKPCLTNWASDKFEITKYGSPFTSDFYRRVFELVLRLRANYLWPCMWASHFCVDDNKSQPLADAFGVVMGTSHTEPLMRATHEWPKFGKGPWQWNLNKENIEPYFDLGIKRAKEYESVFNLAMRGYDDFEMELPKEEAVKVLQEVVDVQRRLLKENFNKPLEDIPQMWCIYKEVQGYFDSGMRVPDDVILLWCDDNWGNIRRLPLQKEKERKGGAGLYYHFDYVGDPRDYKWLNTVSLHRTFEQLNLAHEYGAKKLWILNVGDLKPVEMPMCLYFDLAYDITQYTSVEEWSAIWALEVFGESDNKEIADIITTYSQYASWKKYELVDPETFSVVNYSETERVWKCWEALEKRALAVYDKLSDPVKPSFYQMILHPIKAAFTVYRIHINTAKNNLYAEQRRSSANHYAELVLRDFEKDSEITDEYHAQLDGKWNHMMDQTHLGYNYWQQPMRDVLPPLMYVQNRRNGLTGRVGISTEASFASLPGDDRYHELSGTVLTAPPISKYGEQSRKIDVFSRSNKDLATFWSLVAKDSYLSLDISSGVSKSYEDDITATVTVNWNELTPGVSVSSFVYLITAESKDDLQKLVEKGFDSSYPRIDIPVDYPSVPQGFSGFVESDGHISINAENAEIRAKTRGVSYKAVQKLGRDVGGITLCPTTLESQQCSTGPFLEYSFVKFTEQDNCKITFYCSPSLNIKGNHNPLAYAFSIDDEPPITVEIAPIKNDDELVPEDWEEGVAGNIWKRASTVAIAAGAHKLRLWALEPAVVFQKIVLDFGGERPSYFGPPESYKF